MFFYKTKLVFVNLQKNKKMKYLITPLLFILFSLFCSCKKQEKSNPIEKKPPPAEAIKKEVTKKVVKPKKLEKIVINLKNVKSRSSVTHKKRKRFTKKTAILTTFSDSLDVVKRKFLNETPIDESIVYNIEKEDFINLLIDVSLVKYNYFLKGGDSLTIKFDDKGFVSESLLNGKNNDVALLFSKGTLPNRTIEYTNQYIKLYGNINEEQFNKSFEKKFNRSVKLISSKIEKAKKKTSPIIYNALKNHLFYTKIENEISKGNKYTIPPNDSAMPLYAYRKLKNYILSDISEINYLDNEKLAIRESIKTIGFLMNDSSFKKIPKTRNMIVRELLEVTGQYEPNLLPELLNKITDTKIKTEYTRLFTNQFLLNLKEYRNDTDNINLISIKDPKKVLSFKSLLENYKGKVVYVDLWASWCAPCRKQLPPSHKLKKELIKHPIEFVYFSTDNSFSRWKTAQIEEKMNEDPNSFLLLNTKKSNRYKSWDIMGIPRYLIFDKTGKLVVKDAPVPSDPKTKEELLKYI